MFKGFSVQVSGVSLWTGGTTGCPVSTQPLA